MPIRKLDPIVASRIAAGEVVERPASSLRELIDNSLDAGATKISVYIEEGGIKSLTVADNGCGMSAEDLAIACQSHATSKIQTIDDLYNLSTMGFRGEALCSISACSQLTIQSNGNMVVCDNGIQGKVMPGSVKEGTTITSRDLFENLPARKQFLKRPSSEAAECRKAFIEKALGFPNTEFLFFNDTKLEIHFPKADQKNRALDVMALDKDFVKSETIEMKLDLEPVNLYAVASKPSIYKRDRSMVRILVNNRLIDCYQLVQAVVSAYSVALPGGAFPYFTLYIQDSPTLIDFNVHPSKRKCKIRNQSTIYGMVTNMIREGLLGLKKEEAREVKTESKPLFTTPDTYRPVFEPTQLKGYEVKEPARPFNEGRSAVHTNIPNKEVKFDPSWFETAKKVLSKASDTSPVKPAEAPAQQPAMQNNQEAPSFQYIGQIFNTFLIAQTKDKVLFIDQHAAHERILYDRIVANPDRQPLIVPYRFETDRGTDDFLMENSVVYQEFGVDLVRVCPMVWEMTSIPAVCRSNEEKIANFIKNSPGDINEARKGLFAVIACHSAIKAGDKLDDITAVKLLEKVFQLDAMLCPHGRSFVYEISKEDLFKYVGRIV